MNDHQPPEYSALFVTALLLGFVGVLGFFLLAAATVGGAP